MDYEIIGARSNDSIDLRYLRRFNSGKYRRGRLAKLSELAGKFSVILRPASNTSEVERQPSQSYTIEFTVNYIVYLVYRECFEVIQIRKYEEISSASIISNDSVTR